MKNVSTGEVVLVRDTKGIVKAYQNPFHYEDYDKLLKLREQNNKVKIEHEENNEEKDKNEKIENLTNYELYKLFKDAKKHNNYKEAKKIKKELFFRPETHQEHKHKSLERILKKEERMIEYD